MDLEELTSILKRNLDVPFLELLFDSGQEKSYYFSVSGSLAVDYWYKLRGLVDETGFWPVLLGYIEWDIKRNEFTKITRTTKEIIDQGLTVDAALWLKEQYDLMYDNDEDYQQLHQEWPTNFPVGTKFELPVDYMSGNPREKIYIGLVPTKISWQLPAYLRFGDWNYCPEPEEHVSIMKYWQERYGTEIVSMSHDTIELRVAQPPIERAEALELAEYQYAYCCDIVEQGVGSLEALADTLLGGTVWVFSWD